MAHRTALAEHMLPPQTPLPALPPLVAASISPPPTRTLAQAPSASPLPSSVSKVEQYPHDLLLMSLSPHELPSSIGGLINLMFFAPSSRFFSYTHTHDELSLLLDVATAERAFPPGVLSVGPGAWRLLEIQEGSEIIDTPGIVSSLCAPLFEQQRVEEMLYLSTFVSDLILVRAKHIDLAEQIVGQNLDFLLDSQRRVKEAMARAEEEEREAQRRRAVMEEEDMRRANEEGQEEEEEEEGAPEYNSDVDGEQEFAGRSISVASREDLPLPPASIASSVSSGTDIFQFSLHSSASALPSVQPLPTRLIPSLEVATSSGALQQLRMEPEGDDGIAMHLSKLPFRLVLLTFHAQYLPQCMHAIVSALMRNSSTAVSHASAGASSAAAANSFNPSFFSFTQAGTQVSLIVEADCVALFPPHLVTQHRSVWNALQVSQGTDSTDPAGLVAPLSSVLARVGVSIFYLSTFNLDYILVSEKEVQLALDTLTREMSVMVESEL